MKNLFFAVAFVLTGSVAFAATNEIREEVKSGKSLSIEVVSEFKQTDTVQKTCYYKIVNAAGETVGHVIMEGVPDDVACGSKGAKAQALSLWQNG